MSDSAASCDSAVLVVLPPDPAPELPPDQTPDLSRPLLGRTLAERAVLAGRKAGFARVVFVSQEPPDLPGAERVAAPDEVPGEPATVVRIAANALPEPDWLRDGLLSARGEASAPAAAPLVLRTRADWVEAERRLIRGLVKETDGPMAKWFARPISLRLSRQLAKTGITPNQMTVVSLLIGLAAAPFFLFSTPWLQAIGGILFIAHSVIDGCDGELARLKFTESRFGGLLDFWSDNVVHVAVFACMAIGWSRAEGALWPLALGAFAVLGTAGSAFAVWWFTLRRKQDDGGPVYTSVAGDTGGGTGAARDSLTSLLDALSRRDFIYLVFALSLFGKAAWFLALTAVGAPIFLVLILIVVSRRRRREPDQAKQIGP